MLRTETPLIGSVYSGQQFFVVTVLVNLSQSLDIIRNGLGVNVITLVGVRDSAVATAFIEFHHNYCSLVFDLVNASSDLLEGINVSAGSLQCLSDQIVNCAFIMRLLLDLAHHLVKFHLLLLVFCLQRLRLGLVVSLLVRLILQVQGAVCFLDSFEPPLSGSDHLLELTFL